MNQVEYNWSTWPYTPMTVGRYYPWRDRIKEYDDRAYELLDKIFIKKNDDNGGFTLLKEHDGKRVLSLDVPGFSKKDIKAVHDEKNQLLEITSLKNDKGNRKVNCVIALQHGEVVDNIKVADGVITVCLRVPPTPAGQTVEIKID